MYSELNTVWVLICTVLIFFMQAGFAMLETGFTRAKNAGNIIMKNLMDYCIGSVLFWVVGFSLIYGKSLGGFIGKADLFADGHFDLASGLPTVVFLMFATVFCATATTIVSGAMAGRTSFRAYLIYSAIMSAVVYPISAHWIWNSDGWLKGLGFHDFAGGTAVHVVGGTAALVGAVLVGARIGKFDKHGKAKAIPGHNLTIGALGIFILWLGWFGFNGGSLLTAEGDLALTRLGQIFFNTNISAAACAISTMFITWVRYGKPDVTMTLNGALAGLVTITCGADTVSSGGALVIGATAAFVLVFTVELFTKLKVDDPVGAISVHGMCGAWGSILTGLFSTDNGFLYTGKADGFLVQLFGVAVTAIWTAVIMLLVFTVIKHTIGLRVSEHTEITGLDKCEHGLSSSYADLLNSSQFLTAAETAPTIRAIDETTQLNAADYKADGKMRKVVVLMNVEKFEILKNALDKLDITGMTVTQVCGCGIQKGKTELYRGAEFESRLLPKIKVEIVISTIPLGLLVDTIKNVLFTGKIGDGKIFVYDVSSVVKIRTGAEDTEALE